MSPGSVQYDADGNEISIPNKTCPDNYDFSTSNTAIRYQRMRDALQKQDRNILYSLCEWGEMKVELWGNDTAMSWRSTGDINRTILPRSLPVRIHQNSIC
jgi:hypothetical protein